MNTYTSNYKAYPIRKAIIIMVKNLSYKNRKEENAISSVEPFIIITGKLKKKKKTNQTEKHNLGWKKLKRETTKACLVTKTFFVFEIL